MIHEPAPADDGWRQTHLGCRLGDALRRYDERVLALIAANAELPLKLANYAAQGVVTAAQLHLTRHLALAGSRPADMARSAGMTRQAMAAVIAQCEAMGLVASAPDPRDARARLVRYTETGLLWRRAFGQAVTQAEREFRDEVGDAVATVVTLGLEAYAGGWVSGRQHAT